MLPRIGCSGRPPSRIIILDNKWFIHTHTEQILLRSSFTLQQHYKKASTLVFTFLTYCVET